jgi:pyrrolidone-carboxylate peptidase
MLAQFSRDSSLNPQGWQGSNWEGRGYDVVSFFPDPEGYVGDFEVDYQDTWKDFDRVVEEWNPIAIMAHGRGVGPWELEVRARNLDHWGDDPTPPSQPIPNPPDSTVDAGVARQSTLPNDEIAEAVNQLDLEGIGPTGAWVNEDGNAGGYLCEYMAYLVMWHQAVCASEGTCDCLMAGFTHVGSNVPIASGERATEAALRVLIEALDEQRR